MMEDIRLLLDWMDGGRLGIIDMTTFAGEKIGLALQGGICTAQLVFNSSSCCFYSKPAVMITMFQHRVAHFFVLKPARK